uniref:Complement C1q-like protein 4 n=1 Tax=Magallana gigas TaxID=29159 RepID=K1Q0A5_MAGGI
MSKSTAGRAVRLVTELLCRLTKRFICFPSREEFLNIKVAFHKIASQQVAFFVYMSQNVLINTISKYKTFVYDRVETNVGNGYNVQTGNFTAPESGVYVFHTTTAAFDKSHSTIEIVANGQVKDITWADAMDHNDRAVASSMTVLSLTGGDVVYVRVGLTFAGNYLESNQYTRMSFSGFKLA